MKMSTIDHAIMMHGIQIVGLNRFRRKLDGISNATYDTKNTTEAMLY